MNCSSSSNFKRGELVAETGSLILWEGAHSAQLFTLLSGWAFRFKTLDDGRRQILNYVLPGDLVGLQGSIMGEMQHSVEALSPVVLCVFQRDKLPELYRGHPGTWLRHHLAGLARRADARREPPVALGGAAPWSVPPILIAFVSGARGVGSGPRRLMIPITQQHVADTLGLSIVHTNKTLRKLAERKLIRWHDSACEVLDPAGLTEVAGWQQPEENKRPLI